MFWGQIGQKLNLAFLRYCNWHLAINRVPPRKNNAVHPLTANSPPTFYEIFLEEEIAEADWEEGNEEHRRDNRSNDEGRDTRQEIKEKVVRCVNDTPINHGRVKGEAYKNSPHWGGVKESVNKSIIVAKTC